jgi:hypothetical protein
MHYRDKDGTMKQCLYDEIMEVDHYEESIKLEEALTTARIKIKDLPIIS